MSAGQKGQTIRGRKSSPWLVLHSTLTFAFLYLPIIVLVVYSFNKSRFGANWTGFSTHWYETLFQNRALLEALFNTSIVAVSSTAISVVIGTALGVALGRYTFRARGFITLLLVMPIVIPDVVLAVSLLLFYAIVRQATGLFELGLPTIILAHVTFQLSYVALVVRSRFAGADPSLEEAARDLGAGAWQTFRYVTWPLIFPGVLAGALLAFTLSIDDFVVTFFTAGPGSTTLPVYVYSSVKRGVSPEINALSTLIVSVTVLAVVVGNALLRRPIHRKKPIYPDEPDSSTSSLEVA